MGQTSPAEEAKARGNELFMKGKFSAAADAYTEAIVRTLFPPPSGWMLQRWCPLALWGGLPGELHAGSGGGR